MRAFYSSPEKPKLTALLVPDPPALTLHLPSPRMPTFSKNQPVPPFPRRNILPLHHQPLNPEDEDDVVPDQHAAFGIQRANQKQRRAGLARLGPRRADAKRADRVQ